MMNLNRRSFQDARIRGLELAPRLEAPMQTECGAESSSVLMPSADGSCISGAVAICALARPSPAPGVKLAFFVSSDEEYVRLHALRGPMLYDLGDRAHNYLLLTLARRRIEDAAENLPDSTCGWVDQEAFSHDPSMAPARLNVAVFRIRKQFESRGICVGSTVIERRVSTRQLRLGIGDVSIHRI